MKSVALLLLSVVLAACFGAAPPRPAPVPLPPLVEGGQLVVHTEQRTRLETVERTSTTCPAGHSETSSACMVTRYKVKEPVTQTYSKATYADQPISYGQFRRMTDTQYERKLARLEALSRECGRANTSRYVGLGGLIVGLGVGPLVARADGTAGRAVMGVGIVGGLASYAVGYFAFGGSSCGEAVALYQDVDIASDADTEMVKGERRALEMQELANRFNAMQASDTSQSSR